MCLVPQQNVRLGKILVFSTAQENKIQSSLESGDEWMSDLFRLFAQYFHLSLARREHSREGIINLKNPRTLELKRTLTCALIPDFQKQKLIAQRGDIKLSKTTNEQVACWARERRSVCFPVSCVVSSLLWFTPRLCHATASVIAGCHAVCYPGRLSLTESHTTARFPNWGFQSLQLASRNDSMAPPPTHLSFSLWVI